MYSLYFHLVPRMCMYVAWEIQNVIKITNNPFARIKHKSIFPSISFCGCVCRSVYGCVLVWSGCSNRNAVSWVADEPQTLTAHSRWAWEALDHGAGRIGISWGHASLMAVHSSCFHMAERTGDLSGASSIWTLISFMRGVPFGPRHFPNPHFLIPSPWGLGFQHDFWGDRYFIAVCMDTCVFIHTHKRR